MLEINNPEAIDSPVKGRNVHPYDGTEKEISGASVRLQSGNLALALKRQCKGFWQHGNISISTAYL